MSKEKSVQLFSEPVIDAKKLKHTYFAHLYDGKESTFARGKDIDLIRFDNGKLVIDDLPVLKPHFGHDMVTWKQQTKDHFTSGHLFFVRGGTELHGVVYRGANCNDAVEHHVLATNITPVSYVTQITKKRFPVDRDPAKVPTDEWQDGLVLKIGYEQEVGENIPSPKVYLNDQDVSDYVSWSIDQKTQNTKLLLVLDSSVVCDFDESLYLNGEIEFDILQPLPVFNGTVTSTCLDKKGTGTYLWKGQSQNQSVSNSEIKTLELTCEDLVEDDVELSVAELMSIVPDENVSKMSQSMLVENMKWAMGQGGNEKKWLSEIFGETPPAISPKRQTLVKKSMTWYQNDFSKSYLGWAISNYDGPHAPAVKLDDSQKLKLKNYLTTGISKTKDFTVQQNGIYIDAFIEAKPRLQDYLDDGGEKWANELFKVITSPPQFILMVNRIFGAAGQKGTMAPANNLSTLLTILEPASKLARKYYTAVITGTLSNTVHQSTAKKKELLMEWLPDILKEFLNQVATGGAVPDSAKLAAQQLKEFLKEKGNDMTAVASELADFVVNANGANILKKTQNAETAFMKRYPKFQAVGQMMFFAAWVGGILYVIKAFTNWKSLGVEAKAKAVVTAVTLGFEALDIVPQMIKGIKDMGLKGWSKFTEWRNSLKTQESLNDLYEDIELDYIKNGADETTKLLDVETKSVKAEGTTWADIFETIGGVVSKIVGIVGIAASAIFAAFATYDFIADIVSGQPITKDIFDGLLAATNIAMTVCLCLDLLVATTIFAMAAAVFAIIGVVLVIIAMFVVKPKNPLDDFMKKTIIPFVDGLKEQVPAPALAVL